jgi:hypothetical protein
VARVRDREAGTLHRRETHAPRVPLDSVELAWNVLEAVGARMQQVVVRKNSIRAIGAEYEHESHGMMSA